MILPKVDSFTIYYHGLVETFAGVMFGYTPELPPENRNIILQQTEEFIKSTPAILKGLEALYTQLTVK